MNPDKEVIRKHGQLYENSCTPMIVELILKLTGRVPENYFELQDVSKNTAVSFADFHEQEIGALKLRRRFSVDAGRDFPPDEMKQLFDTIDGELNAGRYVAVSIAQGPNWHNFVVYDHAPGGEYHAVSKAYRVDQSVRDDGDTWRRCDIRKAITDMTGTDILTYDPIS